MDEQTQPQFTLPKRRSRFFPLFFILLLLCGAFYLGYAQGQKGVTFDPKNFKVINKDSSAATTTVDYNLLWDAIGTLNKKYIDKPVSEQTILYGAVKGAVGATGDPYTEFFTPEELQSFKTDLKGSFDGIGAEIGKRNGNIVIIAPLAGSPAEKAGLRPKDIIAKVNGELVSDWSVEQAVNKIRGQKGTNVTLTIVRDGFTEAQDFTITRDTIEVKSVQWEVREVAAPGGTKQIGVITLSRFGDDTSTLMAQAARDLTLRGIQGIVLDLRNDPGGYLDTAVQVASYWLPKGTLVVTEAHSDSTEKQFMSTGIGSFAGIPTITLINGGSASASEIVAGALRDHNATRLVGEKSFGKGSVQEIVELSGGSAIKVTVAKWVTPGGKNLNQDGLNPDVEVELTGEDIEADRDPQLDKALEEVIK